MYDVYLAVVGAVRAVLVRCDQKITAQNVLYTDWSEVRPMNGKFCVEFSGYTSLNISETNAALSKLASSWYISTQSQVIADHRDPRVKVSVTLQPLPSVQRTRKRNNGSSDLLDEDTWCTVIARMTVFAVLALMISGLIVYSTSPDGLKGSALLNQISHLRQTMDGPRQ